MCLLEENWRKATSTAIVIVDFTWLQLSLQVDCLVCLGQRDKKVDTVDG
jgi:hypothetical protein